MRIQLQVKRSKRQACPDFVPLEQQTDSRQSFRANKIPIRNKELKFLTVVKRDAMSCKLAMASQIYMQTIL